MQSSHGWTAVKWCWKVMTGRSHCAVLGWVVALCALLGLSGEAQAQTVTAVNGLDCVADRIGRATGCTAGDFMTSFAITNASSGVTSCMVGDTFTFDGTLTLNGGNAKRYDIGFFVGEAGNSPGVAGGTCSVAVFPQSPAPWFDGGPGSCGDFNSRGSASPLVKSIQVACQPDSTGVLQVPYMVTYGANNSESCTSASNVEPSSSSKCNSGFVSVVGIYTLPTMTLTDNQSSVYSGSASTYTLVISNTTAITYSGLTLTNPAVSGITLNSLSCSASGGATCPSSPTVAALQGGGLTNLSIPSGGTLTFTLNTTLTGTSGFLINTARLTRSGGQYIEASDSTEIFSCSPPSNTPSGLSLTCVCDNFSRGTLNPSTIFNSNWLVSTSDSTGVLPYIANSGYLRLTESTAANAKAATVPGIFPASGNYISVEFKHYAYSGSGADGMAVILSDYSVPAVPGAFGGSLGYAQKSNPGSDCTKTGGCPGFAGGWIGVALDEYGNYQNASEGRVNGPGERSDSVAIRGSGSGSSGYPWLGGTSTLSPGIDNKNSSSPSYGYTYQVVVDARGEPSSTSVRVNRDTGSGYSSLINLPNVYTAATAQGYTQAAVPDNWQISFTGSTGSLTNIHEIGALKVCAQYIYPPSGGAASGFNAIDEAYGNADSGSGVAVQNYLTGHIYTKLMGTPFKLNVAALNNSQIQTAYAISTNKYVQLKLVNNSDGVCVQDASQSNYCNSACVGKAAVSGGSQNLTFSSANSGQRQSNAFTLNSAYQNLVAVMRECTSSSCTSFTSTAAACSVDAFSVRPLGISSVSTTTATNSGSVVVKAGSGQFDLTATIAGVSGNANGYTGLPRLSSSGLAVVSPATTVGTLAGTFGAATSGTPSATATASNVTYSEVGAFYLLGYDPASDAYSTRGIMDGVVSASDCVGLTLAQCDALRSAAWTGIDALSTKKDCVVDSFSNVMDASGKYGCNFGLTANSAAFGRFVPDHFDTVANSACSGVFTYSGQPFGVKVTAKNGSGATTLNYAGTLAKAGTYADANGASGVFSPTTVPATAYVAGVADLTASPQVAFTFSAKPQAPSTLKLRVVDTDSVSSATGSEGTMLVRSGRMRLSNVYGYASPLSMPVDLQYWSGNSWVKNTDDSCTTLAAANLVPSATGWTVTPSVINLGAGSIAITPPSGTKSGALSLCVDLGTDHGVTCSAASSAGEPWLQSIWPGSTTNLNDPSAQANFGIFSPEGRKGVYNRELY